MHKTLSEELPTSRTRKENSWFPKEGCSDEPEELHEHGSYSNSLSPFSGASREPWEIHEHHFLFRAPEITGQNPEVLRG